MAFIEDQGWLLLRGSTACMCPEWVGLGGGGGGGRASYHRCCFLCTHLLISAWFLAVLRHVQVNLCCNNNITIDAGI